MTRPMKDLAVSCWIALRRDVLSFWNDRFPAQYNHSFATGLDEDTSEGRKLKLALKAIPVRVPPADLRTRLRIMASRESQTRRTRATWAAFRENLLQDLRLFTNNLMRPLAIPTAGGFASAVVLFGVLAASISVPGVAARANDVPTMLYTGASVSHFIPVVGFDAGEELVVEITVDENGKLLDYSIPNCENKASHLHRSIENQILFTQFTPATSFGQKISGGKVRITFTSSRIDVKG